MNLDLRLSLPLAALLTAAIACTGNLGEDDMADEAAAGGAGGQDEILGETGGEAPQGGSGGCDECPIGGAGGATPEPPEPPEPPSGPHVCYPGANGLGDACVALVPWSAAWGNDYGYPDHNSSQYTAPAFFVDLSATDGGLAIAANFVLEEVMQEWKGRYAVFQPHVVAKLQEIREIVGASLHINSAFRSPAYNASVGGVTFSRHMYGDAADMWSDGASVSEVGAICDSLGAGYVGLYSSFTHCDWRNVPLDPSFYPQTESSQVQMPEHTAELVPPVDGGTWHAPATGFDEGEPLRVWTAYDTKGHVIEVGRGASYQPPANAARLHVRVGGQVALEAAVAVP